METYICSFALICIYILYPSCAEKRLLENDPQNHQPNINEIVKIVQSMELHISNQDGRINLLYNANQELQTKVQHLQINNQELQATIKSLEVNSQRNHGRN